MKKLQSIKQQLETVGGDVTKLKGFRYVRKPDAMSEGIYINRKKGVVVKYNHRLYDSDGYPKVPTEYYGDVAIQPLCKPLKNKIKALTKFLDKHGLEPHEVAISHDIHEDNIMLYRNQVVAIDW